MVQTMKTPSVRRIRIGASWFFPLCVRREDKLQACVDGHSPGEHHSGLRRHHVVPVQSAERRKAGHSVAQTRGVERGKPLQLHNWGRRPPVCGAAHGGGVVPTRRLLPQQAAHHPCQGGGRRHVHLPGRQHHGLQFPQRLPHRAARWDLLTVHMMC